MLLGGVGKLIKVECTRNHSCPTNICVIIYHTTIKLHALQKVTSQVCALILDMHAPPLAQS